MKTPATRGPSGAPSEDHVLFDVTFSYLTSIVLKGRRKAERAFLRSSVPVAIRVVDAGSAPAVVRLGRGTIAEDIRSCAGGWLAPVRIGTPPFSGAAVAEFLAARGDPRFRGNNPFVRLGDYPPGEWSRISELPSETDAGFTVVPSPRRGEVETSVRRVAAELVMVEGRLHQPCRPPELVVEESFAEPKLLLTSDPVAANDMDLDPAEEAAVFAVDRFEDALAYYDHLIEGRRTVKNPLGRPIEVLRSDLLPRRPPEDLVRVGARAVFVTARGIAGFLPRSGLTAFADLQESCERLQISCSRAEARLFVDALARVAGAAGELARRPGADGAQDAAAFARFAQERLLRWTGFEPALVPELQACDDLAIGGLTS